MYMLDRALLVAIVGCALYCVYFIRAGLISWLIVAVVNCSTLRTRIFNGIDAGMALQWSLVIDGMRVAS